MKHSTKTTVRTIFQAVVMTAVMLPGIVEASGVPQTLPWVAGGLAVAAAVTRIMALPRVQELLDRLGLGTAEADGQLRAGLAARRMEDGTHVVVNLAGADADLARGIRELVRREEDGGGSGGGGGPVRAPW
jgi:hypothetical protein